MDRETAKLAYETGVITLSQAMLSIEPSKEYGLLWEAYKFLADKTDSDIVYEFHDCLVELNWTLSIKWYPGLSI